MRIEAGGSNLALLLADLNLDALFDLLADSGALVAMIKRRTAHSLFLQLGHKEVQIPLAKLEPEQYRELQNGDLVEVAIDAEGKLSFKLLAQPKEEKPSLDHASSFDLIEADFSYEKSTTVKPSPSQLTKLRAFFAREVLDVPESGLNVELLLEILAEESSLPAQIREIAEDSLVLTIEKYEVELPLSELELTQYENVEKGEWVEVKAEKEMQLMVKPFVQPKQIEPQLAPQVGTETKNETIKIPRTNLELDSLFENLSETNPPPAIIKQITNHSFVLEVNRQVFELPLSETDLAIFNRVEVGDLLELRVEAEITLVLQPILQPEPVGEEGMQIVLPEQLETVLLELNIPPTTEAMLVAQKLVEDGFALKDDLIWALMPWAEEGHLEEALLLLKAKFPLKQALVEVVQGLKERSPKELIVPRAEEDMSTEVKELLRSPRLEHQTKWSRELGLGETAKTLARLLVEANLLETILDEYIFAVPFLQNNDLRSAWVRIFREKRSFKGKHEEGKQFLVEIQIPTLNFGVVGALLKLQGKALDVTLKLESDVADLAFPLVDLQEELEEAGWEVKKLVLETKDEKEGWVYAKSSGFAL